MRDCEYCDTWEASNKRLEAELAQVREILADRERAITRLRGVIVDYLDYTKTATRMRPLSTTEVRRKRANMRQELGIPADS